jgi:hypothetical protein
MSWLSDLTGIDLDFNSDDPITKDSFAGLTSGNPFGPILFSAGLNALGIGQGERPKVGYQGDIPRYTATRQRVPDTFDPNRRSGSGGQRYFTDMQYVTPNAPTPMSAEGLAAINKANPAREERQPITTMAAGGIAELKKGRYLDGDTDGMADKVRANIDGMQEARLSDGEYVIPADVVSHLGNGSSEAGAKVLDNMLSRVRKARTGNEKQGKEIDPRKMLPA